MSDTEARTTDGATTSSTETTGEASSAAERLGGPLGDEQSPDTASEAEVGAERRSDAGDERQQSPDTARDADVGADRRTDAAASEGERPDMARRAQTDGGRRSDTDAEQRTTLIPPDRAESYNSRWNELKGEFVDEPRGAVQRANELVGEVLDELEELFRSQRADLEQGLESEQTTTEDLRVALGRYRSFFDRLLSF
jgi:hypothetical protein